MPYQKKSWIEKLEGDKDFPKILELKENFPCWKALKKLGAKPGDSVVLAPGKEIYQLMKEVPKGKLQTLNGLCERLASSHGVDYCCTLTTGIYVNIAANASEEMDDYLPYWRTIKNDGSLNPKYPGGIESHREKLEEEGFIFIEKGRKNIRYIVEDYEKYLAANK
jgi:alkylated DNA nucleotide flippase Atl1